MISWQMMTDGEKVAQTVTATVVITFTLILMGSLGFSEGLYEAMMFILAGLLVRVVVQRRLIGRLIQQLEELKSK